MSKETSRLLYELLTGHPQLVELFARHVKAGLDVHAAGYLKEDYRQVAFFQRRLFKAWKAPMLRLDAMLVCLLEISSEINEEYRRMEVVNPKQLNVVTRLHARAIHIAKEISHFLKGGHTHSRNSSFPRGRTASWMAWGIPTEENADRLA